MTYYVIPNFFYSSTQGKTSRGLKQKMCDPAPLSTASMPRWLVLHAEGGVNVVEAARLATETVPIFHPVNKLRKQMDLGTEMHSAPLKRLNLSLADHF